MGVNKTTAKTILQQLGGNQFIMMTGAKHFATNGNNLSMKIARNRAGNYFIVTLNGMDLYDLEFILVHGAKRTVKKEFKNVYFDELKDRFEEATGLYVTLFSRT